ncbi:Alkaline phosphatase synthesis transcriptional regulatory protein phoP [Desulfamplus magnetovallimortis]|uniref:Alkaline phosphatase synthesis transcriptional regulatory protein phoP n=1 Tax=Desulfamplus magnetovallimortis TaxID=1246637 RepID=A0A1W1HE55_9BACT|nr:response regulator transcription factor [Desulfamplus magnetovallimortis]SLM30759.1 Alkaline phosphatase synthesis transcriptional regulatory protein phoP [Desulfamplus magnetovallimortis]
MSKEHILIVDDEEDILELIKFNLHKEGYLVTTALTGEDAIKIVRKEKIDLMILDLMLPGIDGFEVTREIRKTIQLPDIPIIMLTAKGEEADVVTGLELGADDYIAKPFSPKILLARVRTILRRKSLLMNSSDKENKAAFPHTHKGQVNIFGIMIDPGRYRVEVDGNPVDLTYSEFNILLFLAGHPGWVFTRQQIMDAIRGENYVVTERSIDVQIVGLRKKLGKHGKFIETVRGIGYRLKENSI